MTAHWMQQMGWEVAVLTLDMRVAGTATGAYAPRVLGLDDVPVPSIDVAALHAGLQAGTAVVVDLDWSRGYVAGHIPGAWYAIRARLAEAFVALPAVGTIIFTLSDGELARLAAAEWDGRAPARVLALSGGTDAWIAAGHALERGATHMACAPDDMRLRARDQAGASKMRCGRIWNGRSIWCTRWKRMMTSGSR